MTTVAQQVEQQIKQQVKQQDGGASAPPVRNYIDYIDVGKAIGSRHRKHGYVRAIRNLGAVTLRHAEIVYRDETRWVVDVIRNPDGVVEQQHEFSTYTAAVDVFGGLVEKYEMYSDASRAETTT